MTTLALETNVLKTCVHVSAARFSHTHTHTHTHSNLPTISRQNLCQDDPYTHSYLCVPPNGHFHVEEIQKLSRFTTTSLVALNWSSKLSKQRKLQPNFCLLTVAHVRVWRDCMCHTRNKWTEAPEVDDGAHKVTLETVLSEFWSCSFPVVACTPPWTKKWRCLVAEQLFNMCNICILTVLFDLHCSD